MGYDCRSRRARARRGGPLRHHDCSCAVASPGSGPLLPTTGEYEYQTGGRISPPCEAIFHRLFFAPALYRRYIRRITHSKRSLPCHPLCMFALTFHKPGVDQAERGGGGYVLQQSLPHGRAQDPARHLSTGPNGKGRQSFTGGFRSMYSASGVSAISITPMSLAEGSRRLFARSKLNP